MDAHVKALKTWCRRETQKAINKGILIRGMCEKCQEMLGQAHHDNYTEPMRVRWLCASCHREEHGYTVYPYVPDAARWNKEEKEHHEFRKLLDREIAKLQRQNARLLSAARRSR